MVTLHFHKQHPRQLVADKTAFFQKYVTLFRRPFLNITEVVNDLLKILEKGTSNAHAQLFKTNGGTLLGSSKSNKALSTSVIVN
jgi:hypothetical protein